MRVKAQERSVNGVSHLGAPPLIFIGVKRRFLAGNLVEACNTDFRSSLGVDTWKIEVRGPSCSSAKPRVRPTPSHCL
jgi:hypothetical protein